MADCQIVDRYGKRVQLYGAIDICLVVFLKPVEEQEVVLSQPCCVKLLIHFQDHVMIPEALSELFPHFCS